MRGSDWVASAVAKTKTVIAAEKRGPRASITIELSFFSKVVIYFLLFSVVGY
jgi:hypothetical protein